MSFAFVQDVAASWHQYERVACVVSRRPDGLILHVAGPTDEGVRIIGVWESESAWKRFEDELLLEGPTSMGHSSAPVIFRALHPLHIVHGRCAEGAREDSNTASPFRDGAA